MLIIFSLLILVLFILFSLQTPNKIEYDIPSVAPDNLATKLALDSAVQKMCTDKNLGYDNEKMLCLHTAESCTKLTNWVKNSTNKKEQKYYIWDKGNEICHMGPILSRKYCDSKPDFVWNEDEHRCHVTENYCKNQGVDWDNDKKDCYESGSEGFFEGILGKTVVRSIHKGLEGRTVCNIPKSEQS